jgi:hypothetical protein
MTAARKRVASDELDGKKLGFRQNCPRAIRSAAMPSARVGLHLQQVPVRGRGESRLEQEPELPKSAPCSSMVASRTS